MKHRWIAAACVAALTTTLLAGCGSKETEEDKKAATEEEVSSFTDGVVEDAEEVVLDTDQPLTGKHHVTMNIKDYGTLTIELDADTAPVTVTNFVKLVQEDFYDGLTFHRIMEGFMMQGGDPTGTGKGSTDDKIKGEFASNGVENNISHERGTISMARSSAPDSASCQFFIVHEDSEFLDGDYAAFGHVTEGMEIVDAICGDAEPINDNGLIAEESQPVIASIQVVD